MAGPESARAESKASARTSRHSPPPPLRRLARLLLPAMLLLLHPAESQAQTSQDAAVQVSAAVASASPPQILLSWPPYAASGYTVYRKGYSDTFWGSPLATPPGSATGYLDTTPSAGVPYEYQVARSASVFAVGYVAAGIEVALVETRGKVVLLVDGTQAAAIASELARLQQDLVGDGWTVLRHDVSPTDSVPSVKALIQTDYTADPTGVVAVLLFGHIPVPYSGALNPDGHPDHYGAWPADGFYGDPVGTWTDTTNYDSTVAGRQHNVAGDGKYDQTSFPAPLKLEVGRVDLSNMPAFAPLTETDLLRRYLDKDHSFRHKQVVAQPRGLIDDNFGYFGGEAFAASGWRNFSAFFGAGNVFSLDWFSTLTSAAYLWAYGCGGGWFQGASGVGSTSDFAANGSQAVFTMLFGSYFGDWDVQDNFLKAPLAGDGLGLTDAWAGRPAWHFHHMGMGETIGYSTRLTQNNTFLYSTGFGAGWIHIALMGDPTLRMHPVSPPSGLLASPSGSQVALQWTASPEPVLGYHVYRSLSPDGPFARLSSALVTAVNFTDSGVGPGTYTYMVRAVKLETGSGGSYFNPSQGTFRTLSVGSSPTALYTLTPCRLIDTRLPAGPLGGPALAAGASRTFAVAGSCGIPADASAIAVNVVMIQATAGPSFLTVYPGGSSRPPTSTVNANTGQIRANNAIVALGPLGDLTVYLGQGTGSAGLVLDVNGYLK
jgi:hypothetical protein